ncbi:MAG TPA: hypothetical protein VFT45_27225 [Longimicrobium sp.]|nr:hypothetical protein [Longimicrobium sp.]
MRSQREGMTFEEMVAERDRELARQRAAAGPEELSGYEEPLDRPRPSFMACEAAALPWGVSAERGADYSAGVQHLLSRVWHVMYTLGDQQLEIVRLRENTRQMLARLVTA